jgi:hypothetical protein
MVLSEVLLGENELDEDKLDDNVSAKKRNWRSDLPYLNWKNYLLYVYNLSHHLC